MQRSVRPRPVVLAVAMLSFLLGGCEALQSVSPSKRIDYKSVASAPSLELPPDLTTPQVRRSLQGHDGGGPRRGRRQHGHALGVPADQSRREDRARRQRTLAGREGDARAGVEHVARVLAGVGLRARDGTAADRRDGNGLRREPRGHPRRLLPADHRQVHGRLLLDLQAGQVPHAHRARCRAQHVEVYISHRGMEQVPTGKIDNSSPAAFAWAVMPPNPAARGGDADPADDEVRHARACGPRGGRAGRRRAGSRAHRQAARRLVQADRRRPVRPHVAARRPGTRPRRLHGGRPRPFARRLLRAFRRPGRAREEGERRGLAHQAEFWKSDEKDKPEQYQIVVADTAPASVVSVQDPGGVPDRSPASEKILALLKDQLK